MSKDNKLTLIISVDESTTIDYTAISQKCSNCNTVLNVNMYEPYDRIYGLPYVDKCPKCGVKFKNIKVIKC